MSDSLEGRCAEQARWFINEANLTAHQCELVMFALSTHATEVMSELAKLAGMAQMRLVTEFNDDPKPFVDDRGKTVRLHEYPGFGTEREVYSPQSRKWFHERWVE